MNFRFPSSSLKWACIGMAGLFFFIQLLFVDGLRFGSKMFVSYPWTGLALLALTLLIFEVRDRLGQGKRWPSGKAAFLFSLFLFLSNFRWHGSDCLPTSLLPFGLLEHHTITMDPFPEWFQGLSHDGVRDIGGHAISFFPVLGGILAVPVYVLPALRGVIPTDHILHQLEKMSASLMCAAAVWVLFLIYRRRLSENWAFALAVAYAAGTHTFSLSSQALWQYGPSSLLIVLALWSMDRALADENFWVACGFFAGFSIAARTADSIFFLAFAIVAFSAGGWRGLVRFGAGAAAPGLFLLAYWFGVIGTGKPAEFGTQAGMILRPLHLFPMVTMLFSPGRGIFLFTPVLLFALAGAYITLRDRRNLPWALPLVGAVVASFLFFASYSAWHGGNFSFGERYLIEGGTILFYFLPALVPAIERGGPLRPLWTLAVVISVVCHATGAYARWDWENIADKNWWNPLTYPPAYVVASAIRRE